MILIKYNISEILKTFTLQTLRRLVPIRFCTQKYTLRKWRSCSVESTKFVNFN